MICGQFRRRPELSGALVLIVSAAFGCLSITSEAQAPPTAVGSTSSTQTATVTITTAGTLSSIAVSTRGAAGLDYQVVNPNLAATPCTTGTLYAPGDTCTVQYTFAPTLPGARFGGISIADASGALLGNAYLSGIGNGPLVSFPPTSATIPTNIFTGSISPQSIAVDEAGNVYYSNPAAHAIQELIAVSGVIPPNPTVRTIVSGLSSPAGIALDGAGNLFVADSTTNLLQEIAAVGGTFPSNPVVSTVASGFNSPRFIAVDASGDVFVADNSGIKEVVAVNGVIPPSPTVTTLASGVSSIGIAVDAAGDVFFTNGPSEVDELVAGGSTTPQVVISGTSASAIALDGSGNLYVTSPSGHSVSMVLAVGGVIPASPVIQAIGTGYNSPVGIALDSGGNIFVADNNGGAGSLLELNVRSAPTLTFTSTAASTTSADSPLVLTLYNSGNSPLTFAVPSSGTNPSISAGFILGGGGTCPQLTTASSATPVAAGTACTNLVSFDPAAVGPVTGTLTFTDDNLNVAAATQVAPLAGGVSSPTITVTNLSNPVNTAQVTLTANIAYVGVTPTGAVSFTVNSGTPIAATCTGSTSPLVCTATYNSSALTVNSYPIVATLAADVSTNSATGSGTLAVTVGTPTVVLSSSNASVPVDTPITFTATVTPNTGITPSGLVTFTAILSGNPVALPGCGSVSLVAGATLTATCSANNLVAGSYTVTATLVADTNFTSASNSTTQTITTATPVVSVSSSNASVPVDTAVTLTATVTPNSGIVPTGSVSFTATLNGSPVTLPGCTSVSLVSGAALTASCPVNNLAVGSYVVTATLSGDSNFASASGATTQAVTIGTPVVSLNSSNTSTTVNQQVTLTATVTPNAGVLPTGNVSFSTLFNSVSTPISGCTSVTLSGLTAICNTSTLLAGSNSITATIGNDSNFATAISNAVAHTVASGTPVLALTSSNTPASVNQGVTFTVTVTPNTGIVPTGSVSFSTTLNGTTTVIANCGSVPLTSFTAACPTSTLLAGSNSITATITADSNFTQATSNAVPQTITKASTNLAVTSSSPVSSTVDTQVTFTATLTGAFTFTTKPGTSISFTSNGVAIAGCTNASVSSINSTATCQTSSLVSPSDVIVATYAGDSNFLASTSPQFPQVVSKNTPLISVASSLPTTAVVNQVVTLSATITPPGASSAGVPVGGSVSFMKAGVNVCNPVVVTPIAGGTATAACSVAFTSAFPATNIVATYSGDQNFNQGTAATVSQTVLAAPSTTTVSSNIPTPAVNQPITLTATLTPTNSGPSYTGAATPQSGTITFTDSLVAGAFCTTTVSGGALTPATCTQTFTAPGAHVITASFISTDPNFSNSTTNNSVTVTVGSATQTLAFGNPAPIAPTVNQAATLTASFPNPGSATATGTYAYTDSLANSLSASCTGTVTAVTTIPSCTDTLLIAGTHVITLTFTADPTSGFASATSTLNLIAAQNTPTVTLTSPAPATPATTDQVLTFSATVTPSAVANPAATGATLPTGNVSFTYLLNSVTTTICTAPVNATTGVATCQKPFTTVNSYPITATYQGDASFKTTASATLTQSVTKGGTSLALVSGQPLSSPTTPGINQSAVYTVQLGLANSISDTGLTFPTGNVVFVDQSNPSVTCTVTVQPNGLASCSLSEPTAGSRTIVATYSGDTNFSGTTQNFTEVISVGPTTTTVFSNLPQPSVNQPVTLTAVLTPTNSGPGYPGTATPQSGTITFTDSVVPGAFCTTTVAGGVLAPATCPRTFTATGPHVITATFTSNDPNFSSSTTNISVTVTVGTANTPLSIVQAPGNVTVDMPVTLTAGFPNPGNAVAIGSYTYTDSLSSSLSATCSNPNVATTTTAGVAAFPSCTDTVLAPGAHVITVVFTAGPGSGFASTTATTTVSVGPGPTTVVMSAPTPSGPVTNATQMFTATVTPTPTNPALTGSTLPGGNVTFNYTVTPLAGGTATNGVACTVPVGTTANTTGGVTATCQGQLPAAGNYVFTANYAGDTNFVGPTASASVSETVNKETPVFTVTSSPSTGIKVGDAVTFTIALASSVTTSGAAFPTGQITLTDTSTNPAATLCTAMASTNGTQTCVFYFQSVGPHAISASYKGDANFTLANALLTPAPVLTVLQATPSVVVTSNSHSAGGVYYSVLGQNVIYTAVINPVLNGPAPLLGTKVNFNIPTNPGTCQGVDTVPGTITPNTVMATCLVTIPVSAFLAGTYTVTAAYSGDTNYTSTTFSASTPANQLIQDFAAGITVTSKLGSASIPTALQFNMAQGNSQKANVSSTDPFNPTTITLASTPISAPPAGTYPAEPIAITGCVVQNGSALVNGLTCSFTSTAVTVSATAGVSVGDYTLTVIEGDVNVSGLVRSATATVTIVAQPTTVFINAKAGSVVTANFTVPTPKAALTPPFLCSPNIQIANPNGDGTYSVPVPPQPVTLTDAGLTCTVAANPSVANGYSVTLTTLPILTGRLETPTPTIYVAALGVPVLFLIGLLPGIRRSRKGLMAILSAVFLAVGFVPMIGCGSNGFTPPATQIAKQGSYLILITDSSKPTAKVVAEVPVLIGSF